MKNLKLRALLSFVLVSAIHADHKTRDIATIEDEIAFWAFQEKEHAEFCTDFTNDEDLKKEGHKLSDEFAQIHQNSKGTNKEFLNATKQAKKFQKKVASSLKKNDPDLKIKKDLIDHMNLETDYITKKIKGKITRNEEIKFWIEEHEGEAKATAYFIVDKETPLKQEANELANDLEKKDTQGQPELRIASIANNELNEINEQLQLHPDLTRMPHKLAEHEQRERDHAAEIFKSLGIQ